MIFAYCRACSWRGAEQHPDGGPRLYCPNCGTLIVVVSVGPMPPPPEPIKPDDPQQREPLKRQPRLL